MVIERNVMDEAIRNKPDYKERKQRIEESLPKRQHRLKQVVCPVTGDLTDNRSGLSGEAWQLILDGLKWKKHREKETQTKRRYYYAYGWGKFSNYHGFVPKAILDADCSEDRRYRSTQFDLGELIAVMTNQKVAHSTHSYHGSLELPRLELEPTNSDRLYSLELTEEQAQEARRLEALFKAALEQTRQEAYREGSGFLLKMASGQVTIDQVNAMHTQRGDSNP